MRDRLKPVFILIMGDTLLILFFSWLGRITHHLPEDFLSVLQTAFPFLAAWAAVAPTLGMYRPEMAGGFAKAAIFTGAAVFAGVTAGVLLRSWMLGRPFDWLFYSITILTLLPLFLLWRLLFAWRFRRRSTRQNCETHA
jgi:hypothetical protein